MVLVLKPSPAQQTVLNRLTQAQQTPGAPEFHHWLTPEEFGSSFGLSNHDLAAITGWLSSHGFSVDEVAADKLLVIFSGTAGQVADTFHTELHRYVIPIANGHRFGPTEMHIANVQDPQIPAAFAEVVEGVLSLHDFRRMSSVLSRPLTADLDYTGAARHSLTPAEFAMLYNLPPLYASGETGAGVTIAIVSRSNFEQRDLDQFRALNGLGFLTPTITLVNGDPGAKPGDEDEAISDAEWSDAVAPGAAIQTVVADSTATTDGVDLAVQYILNHVSAQIVDMGFVSCEPEMGTAELAFYGNLWQQAAAEGISVLVASGNGGAAACRSLSPSTISTASVNGLCSSPYSTCVGGTQFGAVAASAMRGPESGDSIYDAAAEIMPESVWNESRNDAGPAFASSGGGWSKVFEQPDWQRNTSGTAEANGMRAVPDLSFTASSHPGYLTFKDGSLWVSFGTSASASSFAGIVALAVQANGGSGLGNINPSLYQLLHATHSPFNVTRSGDNTVPGVPGYAASGADFNLSTGLGSVNAALLVEEWMQQMKAQGLNGGTRIQPSASSDPNPAPRRVKAIPVLPISVASFHPDPTGKTDSTAAFQAAFDSDRSTVVIPAGTYLLGCTNPLYISRNNITYSGAGQAQTILRSCQGHTVAISTWSCVPTTGSSCISGKGPFTFTINTSSPLLAGIDNYYCSRVASSNTCALENWHGEFPGFATIDEQFTLSGAGFPAFLSTTLANPIFNCGTGCQGSPAAQTSFTIASTAAPTANSGSGGTFSMPQNVVQAYDPRSNTRQTGSRFSNLTFDGGCNQCQSSSFDTGLVDMRNPQGSTRQTTANLFENVTFSNYADVAVREDLTQGDTFTNISFVNGGNVGISGDSPNNLTVSNVTATNFGWQTDVRVVATGTIYANLFGFGCSSGGHTMAIQNVTVQPSKNSQLVGLSLWCGTATTQTATASAYSGVQISNFTIVSAGNQLLPVSAFADNMTIHGFNIQGYSDPAVLSSPYMEVAGSNMNLYGNTNVAFFFAPIDEGTQVDGGVPVHTHYTGINIHDNIINCTTPTQLNTGCVGIAIGGFQNSLGETTPTYIDSVNIYNNKATYTFGPVNQGQVVHISLGQNEGATGIPVGQLTNVHVHNETVTISGSQSMGGGWSAFATLNGGNPGNANWTFAQDAVKWTNTRTLSNLEHLRATHGAVASGVTAQSESTPASPLLTNDSGGSFAGITVVQ